MADRERQMEGRQQDGNRSVRRKPSSDCDTLHITRSRKPECHNWISIETNTCSIVSQHPPHTCHTRVFCTTQRFPNEIRQQSTASSLCEVYFRRDNDAIRQTENGQMFLCFKQSSLHRRRHDDAVRYLRESCWL